MLARLFGFYGEPAVLPASVKPEQAVTVYSGKPGAEAVNLRNELQLVARSIPSDLVAKYGSYQGTDPKTGGTFRFDNLPEFDGPFTYSAKSAEKEEDPEDRLYSDLFDLLERERAYTGFSEQMEYDLAMASVERITPHGDAPWEKTVWTELEVLVSNIEKHTIIVMLGDRILSAMVHFYPEGSPDEARRQWLARGILLLWIYAKIFASLRKEKMNPHSAIIGSRANYKDIVHAIDEVLAFELLDGHAKGLSFYDSVLGIFNAAVVPEKHEKEAKKLAFLLGDVVAINVHNRERGRPQNYGNFFAAPASSSSTGTFFGTATGGTATTEVFGQGTYEIGNLKPVVVDFSPTTPPQYNGGITYFPAPQYNGGITPYNAPPQYNGGITGAMPAAYVPPPQYNGGITGATPKEYHAPPQYNGGITGAVPKPYYAPPQYNGGITGAMPVVPGFMEPTIFSSGSVSPLAASFATSGSQKARAEAKARAWWAQHPGAEKADKAKTARRVVTNAADYVPSKNDFRGVDTRRR